MKAKMSKTERLRWLFAHDLPTFKLIGAEPPVFDINCSLEEMEAKYGPPPIIRTLEEFRGYQRWMKRIICKVGAVYLAAEMGLGKTAACLAAARELLDLGEIKRILIVAPLKVCELTWPEEIAKWSFARALSYTVVTGTLEERIVALRQDAEITIINRENVVWLKQYVGTRNWCWDMLIYDEASRLKGGRKKTKGSVRQDGSKSAKRISEFGTLARMRYAFKKVVLLSGTPAPNGLIDLWGPMYVIDQGHRLLPSREKFLQRWFLRSSYSYAIEPHDWAEEEIMERLEGVFFSLKEEDYLQVPPIVPVDHWVTLPPKAMEQYRRMEKTMVLSEFDAEAVNNGVLTNKLLQIANGSIYDSEGKSHRLHDEKLDVLDSIMAEAAGRPVLLGYQFKFDAEAIRKKFPYARFFGESKNDKRDWDAGKIRLLVTHPASAGHGLNLQLGGNIQVWYGLTWSLELYQQFIKRLQRSGQLSDRVFLHRIMAKNTADEAMAKLLTIKGITQDRITDAVKADVIGHLRQAANDQGRTRKAA